MIYHFRAVTSTLVRDQPPDFDPAPASSPICFVIYATPRISVGRIAGVPEAGMLQYSLDEITQTALINEGLLTQEQLSKARKIAAQLDGQKSLGDVLLEMNWISKPRLEDFVRRCRSTVSISDILISRRPINENDVRSAREIQSKTNK